MPKVTIDKPKRARKNPPPQRTDAKANLSKPERPERPDKRITLNLDVKEEFKEKLRRAAFYSRKTMTDILIEGFELWLAKHPILK